MSKSPQKHDGCPYITRVQGYSMYLRAVSDFHVTSSSAVHACIYAGMSRPAAPDRGALVPWAWVWA